jgi:hypothetical protein
MGLGVLLLGAGWLSGVCALAYADVVDLDDRNVRIRDIATLECVPPEKREALGNLVVGRLHADADHVRLHADDLVELIRLRAPGLELVGDSEHRLTVRLDGKASRPATTPSCWMTARRIPAGSPISREDLVATTCAPSNSTAGLVYDRYNGMLRAKSDLPEGAYAGRLSVTTKIFVDAGDELLLAAELGSVRIERRVWAMQPAPGGGEIFVRDEAGVIFSAPVLHSSREEGAQ